MNRPLMGCVVLLIAPWPAAAADPAADRVVAAVIAGRERIKSGHARIELDRMETVDGKETKAAFSFEVWQQPDRYRVDLTEHGPFNYQLRVGFRVTLCDNCERPGHFVTAYGDGPVVNRLNSQKEPDTRQDAGEGIDLRFLGLVGRTWPSLKARRKTHPRLPNLRSTVGSPEYPNPSLGSIPEGLVTLSATHAEDHLSTLVVTVDPARGHAVTRIDGRNTIPKTGEVNTWRYVTTYYPAPFNDVHFPSEVLYEGFSDGKLDRRDRYTITDVAINAPIDPVTFTFAGIGVKDGKIVAVSDEPGRSYVYWKGALVREESVPELRRGGSAAAPDPPPVAVSPDAASTGLRWWYAVPAAACAAAAVFFFRRVFARGG